MRYGSRCIAALRFQPTKRPQLSSQKTKPKSAFPKPNTTFSNDPVNSAISSNAARPQTKSTLADWTATGDDDDINGFYGGGEKRQRGGRKKRKKNREEHAVAQDWDDIYDPSRPNSYDEYKHSDEKIREIREWKDRLYAHRIARKHSSDGDSEDEEPRRPQMSSMLVSNGTNLALMRRRSICSAIQLLLCSAAHRCPSPRTCSRFRCAG